MFYVAKVYGLYAPGKIFYYTGSFLTMEQVVVWMGLFNNGTAQWME